jgi:DNA end-binding protein Ku
LSNKTNWGFLQYEKVCSVDGKPVPFEEIVKGYEYEKGQWVTLTDEDFAKVNPAKTQTVEILEFVSLDQINPMLFNKPYYLEPSKPGAHAYALLREALALSNRVAIARVVLRTKEYVAAVKPVGDVLVLQLLHWAHEVVSASSLTIPEREALPEAELKMAKMLVDQMRVKQFEPARFTNSYRNDLLAMIEAKAAGKELPTQAPLKREKATNLMDVLMASIEATKAEAA